jgi:hypothetical protein
MAHLTALTEIHTRRSARLYNGMTQTTSAIIIAIKLSMEYAKLCMSMRLGHCPLFAM